MKKTTARDLMVPLEEHATVSEEATLKDAVNRVMKKGNKWKLSQFSNIH